MSEIDLEELKRIYEELKKLKDRWAPDDGQGIDDAEEMWVDIPEFLYWAVPAMGIALGVDVPKLYVISAVYESEKQSMIVTEKIRSEIKDGKIELQVLNTTFGRDPDFGQKKNLRVDYRLNGEPRKIEIVREGEWLRIGVA